MRKLIFFLLALLFVVSIAACSHEEESTLPPVASGSVVVTPQAPIPTSVEPSIRGFVTRINYSAESTEILVEYYHDENEEPEYQYDKENIYLYYYGTNEYTIQKRKESSSNIFENPFAFLSKPENLTVSDPSLEILDGKRVKVLTVTPAKGGKQSFQSAKVYLKENLQTPQLVKIDIYTANGGKFQLTVTSISQRLSVEQASAYKIDLSAHKGVIINDLR